MLQVLLFYIIPKDGLLNLFPCMIIFISNEERDLLEKLASLRAASTDHSMLFDGILFNFNFLFL